MFTVKKMKTFKSRHIKAAFICASQRLVSLWMIILFNLCFLSVAEGQDALKYLKIKGRVVENNANALVGAKAILYKNSVKIDEKYASKDGRFFFTLELNQRYLVEVTKPYFITKKISFSTSVPPDLKVIYPYKFTINIFKYIEGIDYSVLKRPIGHVKYYSEANKFDYDEDYTNSIMAKLEKLYEQIAQKEIEMEEEAGMQKPPSGSPQGESASTQDNQSEKEIYERIDQILAIEPKEKKIIPSTRDEKDKPTYTNLPKKEPPLHLRSGDIIYKMQIVTSRKSIPLIAANFKGLEGVNVYFDNGLYKYTVGETTNYKYATTVLKERIRKLGFKNAFVVSFKNNKRINEKYKDENISTKLKDVSAGSALPAGRQGSVTTDALNMENKEEQQEFIKIKSETAKQKQKTKAFLNRKNAELETKALKKQIEKEREINKIQEVKDKLAMAKSRKIFLEEIADSKRTMKKREARHPNGWSPVRVK